MRTPKKVRPTRREELDSGLAFISDFRHGFTPVEDGDVEALGEEFVAGALSNDAMAEIARNEEYAEETFGALIPDLEAASALLAQS